MKAIAPAILYALFVWWFSTGLVLLLVLRKKATSLCLAGAVILFPVSLLLLSVSGGMESIAGVYIAFTAAILLWATQEIAFLSGYLTGPRPLPCPPGVRGLERLRYALAAILYHEIALIVSGAAAFAVTWQAANQTGALTFLVLWLMRVSAKLNLYLGVPVLNDEVLPQPIQHLRSYFLRGPANAFFPIAIVLSVLGLSALVTFAANPDGSTADAVGYTLVATLMGLAIVEHVFMLVPLPVDRLWRWAASSAAKTTPPAGSSPGRSREAGKIEQVAATTP